ncbi:ogr/Delta-like zinc finger family protein, partial [Pseudomonas aeruginosa]
MSVYKLVCPCCHSRMRIRSSEGQTPCFRSMYAQCTNALGGATFTGSLSWDYQPSPPGLDRPRLVLPLTPSHTRQRNRADRTAATHPW